MFDLLSKGEVSRCLFKMIRRNIMKKKIISLAFVTVLAASLLVGCGGDTLKEGNAEITQEETESNFQREKEPTSTVEEEADADSVSSEAE